MLTLNDCIALCDLTKDEVEAIAEHEHIPMIVAAELGNYLVHDVDGVPMIRRFIVDDIEAAAARGDAKRVKFLKLILWHFIQTHPGNKPSA
jgi:hypothetical protein